MPEDRKHIQIIYCIYLVKRQQSVKLSLKLRNFSDKIDLHRYMY